MIIIESDNDKKNHIFLPFGSLAIFIIILNIIIICTAYIPRIILIIIIEGPIRLSILVTKNWSSFTRICSGRSGSRLIALSHGNSRIKQPGIDKCSLSTKIDWPRP